MGRGISSSIVKKQSIGTSYLLYPTLQSQSIRVFNKEFV